MKKIWIVKTVFFVVVAVAAMTAVFMWTWNWLVPDLFHGPVISYFQALGILVLSRLIFRGFHGCGGRGLHYGKWNRWKDKFEQMNPEERERMRELWKKRCGGWKHEDEKTSTENKSTGM